MRYLIVLLLAGCGAIPPSSSSGRFITTQHGSARFMDAMQGATEHCGRMGLGAQHLGTDSPPQALSISRFQCVER